MIEQYVYNLITGDASLAAELAAGGGKYHLYPGAVPRGIEFTKGMTFTLIGTFDNYPAVQSATIQFNIFATTHTVAASLAKMLSDLFNGDTRKASGGVDVVFSIRASESDLGFNYDDKLYQREATYNFKIR